jgi:hypothetical protein
VADRRVPFPPSALSPVSPEVARAAASPFAGGAWIASAVFLLPALVLMAILGEAIRGIEAEGRRRVLSIGIFLAQLIAAAGVVAVQSRARATGSELRAQSPRRSPRVAAIAGLAAGLCGPSWWRGSRWVARSNRSRR